VATGSAPLRRNALANVLGRAGSAGLWIIVTPWVLDHLGPERFAVWSLFFTFGGYVATLDFGMSSAMARHVAVAVARRDRDVLASVLRRSLLVSIALGLLWCVVFAGFRGAFIDAFKVPAAQAPEVAASLLVFALSMLVFSCTQVLYGSLTGFHLLHLGTTFMLSGLALHATILVVGVASGGGLLAAAWASVAGYILTGVLSAVIVRRELRRAPEGAGAADIGWRELLGFGGIVQVSNAFAIGWLQSGKVLLGLLGQLTFVTQFELGYRVTNAVASMPIMIQGAVVPAAAHASASAEATPMVETYRWACRWMYASGGLLLGGLWVTAPALLTMWLGPGHETSATVARLLVIAYALVLLAGPAQAVARGGGWPQLESIQLAIATVLSVVIGLWSIPRYGPTGAAVGMVLSFVVAAAWLVLALHRRLGCSTWDWARTLAVPRFGVPAVVAGGLAIAFAGWHTHGRADAFVAVVVQGAAFLAVAGALGWWTGDLRVIGGWAAGKLRAVRGQA